MNLHQIGSFAGLTTWFLPPASEKNIYKPEQKSHKIVCFFHGFGASPQSLLARCQSLQIKGVGFVLPQAPLVIPSIDDAPDTFAWWRFRFHEALAAIQHIENKEAKLQAVFQKKPIELEEKRKQLQAWLVEIQTHFGISSQQDLILAGYSQGAMVAADLALCSQRSFGGLLLFSGGLINQAEWKTSLSLSTPIPYFQSHGISDEILPFAAGQALHNLLQTSSWPGEFFPFPGGHETTPEVLFQAKQKLIEWSSL